jgi:hypothetical protein
VPTLSIGEWPLDGSWFPPFDPVREAGARTDSPPFTPMCSSPPSVAMRLRIATQTMDGLSWITNRRGDSQAGRRRFEFGLPLHLISGLHQSLQRQRR